MPIEINRKVKRESVLILTISIAILISAAAFRYGVMPQTNGLKVRHDKFISINSLISSENGFAKIVGEIKKKNELIHEKVTSISGVPIENTRDISGFLEVLISKAKIYDIKFSKIEPQNESRNRDFTLSVIVLNFSTTYHSMGQFISSIEQLPQMYRINRLYVESKREGLIDVKLMVTCYIPLQEQL